MEFIIAIIIIRTIIIFYNVTKEISAVPVNSKLVLEHFVTGTRCLGGEFHYQRRIVENEEKS